VPGGLPAITWIRKGDKLTSASNNEHPTRSRILAASEPLFAAHGFSGVSLRTIADAAGVPLGAIPYHFGTKDVLYRAIWELWMGKIPARTLLETAAPGGDGSKPAHLRRVVAVFFAGPRTLLRDPRGQRFVAIMVREAHDPRSAERGLLAEFIYPNGNAIRAELARLFPDMPEDAFAAAFEMMISALRIVIEHRDTPREPMSEPQDGERLFDLLTDFVVHGWIGLDSAAD
jgi:AcrR family transcriptional regulator